MSRPTYVPPLRRRIYQAASDAAWGLVVAGLALAGALWLFGCGASSQQAQAPTVTTTIEDCFACLRCAKDFAERAADKAGDAGSE